MVHYLAVYVSQSNTYLWDELTFNTLVPFSQVLFAFSTGYSPQDGVLPGIQIPVSQVVRKSLLLGVWLCLFAKKAT